ncbi:Soluble aldose sugar dehydrogenase YliI precursor [Candidatus Nitrosocosmicus oleophilus]|uniref:Soluble aldose sugar dehydrogenase YliI n=1 Tax=Candidatus Nitrosocosmicus oleophilus TaxID=1353260 RepID=A0A654M3B0_9ARCH|nr:PQQ-dependent sugar dehydrogenase [Candidatus Nitrosocosmicus oleophilus]ALI37570.1 Soluble aldose sugar dehydrogenase YliI precursor [Candidatus Nitrosocosmicus oleophilus]
MTNFTHPQNVSLDLDANNLFSIDDFSMITSTTETKNNTWSPIFGDTIRVKPDREYMVISNLELNKYAMQSHIKISGFNETSEKWFQIIQCPEGLDGPLELSRFVCPFTVPENVTKIQPIFQSGWSNESGQKAETIFGNFFVIERPPDGIPIVFDNKLKVQEIFHNNITSTAMTFINQNDILLPDSYNGTVYRYVNDTLMGPMVDFNVAQNGLLGLDSLEKNGTRYVYIFVTESGGSEDGDDISKSVKPKCNCIYRFELKDNKLIDPKLIFSVPAYLGGNAHAGGVIRIDKNQDIFVMVGSLNSEEADGEPNLINNEINGSDPDGRSGILIMDYNGKPIKGILGDHFPLNLYYAYGIRNSFGMGFDPVTGYLWDTENGPDTGDEINLVRPGFNSGYNKIDGVWTYGNTSDTEKGYVETLNPSNLVDFNGSGKYRTPELTWQQPIGIVALGFLNSSYLGNEYLNTMFVSDINNGYVYNFKLDKNRTGLELNGPLKDKIVNSTKGINDYSEISSNIFGMNMGLISDIKMGPDGYIYFLKMNDNYFGKLYRLVPNT